MEGHFSGIYYIYRFWGLDVQFMVRLAHFIEQIWTNFNTSVFEGYQITCTQMFFIWRQPIDCSQSSLFNGFHLLLQVLRQTSMPYRAGTFYYLSYKTGVSDYKVFSIGASILKSLRKSSHLFAFRTISPISPIQIAWPWLQVGRFSHGLITIWQKKMWT